eukprot:scaffold62127_cov60-Phaeocystis_antarctica.AAC.5
MKATVRQEKRGSGTASPDAGGLTSSGGCSGGVAAALSSSSPLRGDRCGRHTRPPATTSVFEGAARSSTAAQSSLGECIGATGVV